MSKTEATIRRYAPFAIYLTLALAIMLPLFRSGGYVFLLDMVWGPQVRLSDYLDANTPTQAPIFFVFKLLELFLSAATAQKLLLFIVLSMCGSSMFMLARRIMLTRWAILSGIFYMLNPYVFERFLSGQWLVLAGYAFFPLLLSSFLRFTRESSRKNLMRFAFMFSLYPIISPHWCYISFWFLSLLLIVYALQETDWHDIGNFRAKKIKTIAENLLIVIALFLFMNSFWILNNFGPINALTGITPGDFEFFRTLSDPDRGIYFNVLSLYGFWKNAFFLPKDFFPYWWTLTPAILVFSAIGFMKLARSKNALAIATGIAFIPALIVAVGYGDYATRPVCEFLFRYLPGFGGLRETEKVAGLLAFSYALFLPVGIKAAIDRIFAGAKERTRKIASYLSFFLFFATCCLLVNNMFRGFGGQLKSYEYPDSWYQAEALLADDPDTDRVLFLPWHGYLELSFARNGAVANPAKYFFSADIVHGNNFENRFLTAAAQGEWDARIADMLAGKSDPDDNAEYFKAQGVNRVILAKTDDWERYAFLESSLLLKKIFEADEIVLYEVR